METLSLLAFLAFVAWHVIGIRKDASARDYSTTLYLTFDSEEESHTGVPEKSAHLRRKTKIPIPIVPGMELAEPGEHVPFLVVRVVFDSEARGVHLKPRRVPSSQLESIANAYLRTGWQDGG